MKRSKTDTVNSLSYVAVLNFYKKKSRRNVYSQKLSCIVDSKTTYRNIQHDKTYKAPYSMIIVLQGLYLLIC